MGLRSLLTAAAQTLPPEVRLPARGLVQDLRGLPRRLRDPSRWNDPWQVMHNDGSTLDFRASGEAILAELVRYGGLKPQDRVLDIGCGNGRLARPLAAFLEADARYLGFDLAKGAIERCRRRYGGDSRFSFHQADLANSEYNRGGAQAQEAFVFPAADASIDFALAVSVLPHMGIEPIAQYARELKRVLAAGGRAFLTLFLLDQARRDEIECGHASLPFRPWNEVSMVVDARTCESAIAHEDSVVRALFAQAGLAVKAAHRGRWAPVSTTDNFQDILIVEQA
jgi:SAM-dependent methyltransferase